MPVAVYGKNDVPGYAAAVGIVRTQVARTVFGIERVIARMVANLTHPGLYKRDLRGDIIMTINSVQNLLQRP